MLLTFHCDLLCPFVFCAAVPSLSSPSPLACDPVPVELASNLTQDRFQSAYAEQHRAVVIRGLRDAVLNGDWTLNWIEKLVGHRTVSECVYAFCV